MRSDWESLKQYKSIFKTLWNTLQEGYALLNAECSDKMMVLGYRSLFANLKFLQMPYDGKKPFLTVKVVWEWEDYLARRCASLPCTCSIRGQTANSLGCFNLGSCTECGIGAMIKWPLPILSFDSEAGHNEKCPSKEMLDVLCWASIRTKQVWMISHLLNPLIGIRPSSLSASQLPINILRKGAWVLPQGHWEKGKVANEMHERWADSN